jgi:hypothetical protein
MTGPDRLVAQVLVTDGVAPDQVQTLVEDLASLGVPASSRVVPPHRGIDKVQWLVLVALPLQAFLTGLVDKLAEDAYKSLKSLVGRALGKPSSTTGKAKVLMLQDPATRLQIVLEDDLPAEAYQHLLQLDLEAVRDGPLYYDRQQTRWRSRLDQARR